MPKRAQLRVFNVETAPIIVSARGEFPVGRLKVDKAYRKGDRICIEGWTTAHLTIGLEAGSVLVEVQRDIVARADVAHAFGLASGESLGFVLTAKSLTDDPLALTWEIAGRRHTSVPLICQNVEDTVQGLAAEPLALSVGEARTNPEPSITSNGFEDPSIGAIAIDHGCSLEEGGLLIYGWKFFRAGKVKSLIVHDLSNGIQVDITESGFALPRADVAASLHSRFPDPGEFCGFLFHVPIPTSDGDKRVLELVLEDGTQRWVRVPLPKEELKGIELIKQLLTRVPGAHRMQAQLFNLLDTKLGPVIENISRTIPPFSGNTVVHQFGVPPAAPDVSVIVPLYGRYDFIRYQLSHFADDPDFKNIDLIYVVDDPKIITETHEFATVYHPVFGVPFRTISYASNRGFAGANNIGASIARGDTLVLLNSDVLPRRAGWVTELKQALETLPTTGAVGPLLQFADNSVQHAGMVARRDPRLPGFLLNMHPGKGQPWLGTDNPRECEMLTGACLMMRKADYAALGGFDEGYLIGDFEDSDLCLGLRKSGKSLWLVPAAKMWHLERQSQNLASISGYRQLLTLFNGWRFQQKIRNGEIADPTAFARAEV